MDEEEWPPVCRELCLDRLLDQKSDELFCEQDPRDGHSGIIQSCRKIPTWNGELSDEYHKIEIERERVFK